MVIIDVFCKPITYQVSRKQILWYLLHSTFNYVDNIWEVLLNISFITDPHNKVLSAFIYIQSNDLDEKF